MVCTVLIVDDSKLTRTVLAKAVVMLYPNWRLVEAENADGAMSSALDSRINIALIDYNMPGRNGLSLAAGLRSLHPEMPMALITANFQTEVIARTKGLGLTFLRKPHWQVSLAAFLRAAVGQLD
jgi:DNA-binding NarL/FixJ family response regulator